MDRSGPERWGRRTIRAEAEIEGVGLFSGTPVRMRFVPAAAGQGLVFVRVDQAQVVIPAHVKYAVDLPRRSALGVDGVTVEVTEHVLSAVAGLGITDLRIELDAAETPMLDGSAAGFVEVLLKAGLTEMEGEVCPLVVTRSVRLEAGDAEVVVEPQDEGGTEFIYELDYRPHPFLGRMTASFRVGGGAGDYAGAVAPARTFVLEDEAKALQKQGLGGHLTPGSLLVIGEGGPLAPNRLRFGDEPARHKLLDLLGDIALAGRPVAGRVRAYKAGHALNRAMAVKLLESFG